MLILKQFFQELEQIQELKQSNFTLRSKESYKQANEDEQDYLQRRLDFTSKYARILRGMDLLTDDEMRLLHNYFTGKVVSGLDLQVDKKIARMIHDVEAAI